MAPPCGWKILFAGFWIKILPQLNIKAVHNLITKSLGINPHSVGYVYANFCISTIFGF